MAVYYLRLWWVAAALLLWTPHMHCAVTHEDIRDAMMSLVHMFRNTEAKLERHEYREKTIGEQLKKMLLGLEKRHKMLEPLKGQISRLDERLSNVETILLQKEEREKVIQKKTADALEDIQKSLRDLTSSISNSKSTELDNNLTTDEDGSAALRATSDLKIDALKSEIESLKDSLNKDSLRAMCLEVASDDNPFEKHLTETEKLLSRYELKLNESESNKVQTEVVPLGEVSAADEAWHNKMTEVMEKQENKISKIQRLLSDAESMWKDLPRIADLHTATNQTLAAISSSKEDHKKENEKIISQVSTKLHEMTNRLATTNKDIQDSLTQGNTLTERVYNDISRSYASLLKEVEILTKNEQVVQQTADNVLANKKRIEYGVHQIVAEVGDLYRMQGKIFNKTFSDRFEKIETALAEGHTTTRSNITDKIEAELAPVWRQIGIMYNQLTTNKASLDRLTEQTERYVNESVKNVNNISDKVGKITNSMSDVDENLNYLLGRLSLITQEFQLIKTGLGKALDEAGLSLRSVLESSEDKGPGPHEIKSAK